MSAIHTSLCFVELPDVIILNTWHNHILIHWLPIKASVHVPHANTVIYKDVNFTDFIVTSPSMQLSSSNITILGYIQNVTILGYIQNVGHKRTSIYYCKNVFQVKAVTV